MFGGLEGIILLVPLVYLGFYGLAYLYTKNRFP
jgi:hypothetical protein